MTFYQIGKNASQDIKSDFRADFNKDFKKSAKGLKGAEREKARADFKEGYQDGLKEWNAPGGGAEKVHSFWEDIDQEILAENERKKVSREKLLKALGKA